MSVESHDLGPVPNLTALSGYGDSYVVPGDEVYVVSEDTDYIYLNTGSNPPADGFNIIKAIFLPGVWQRRSSGGGAGALRFNTVAVGALGSGRLIDTSLAGLVDGTSLAWVESVKDTWRWDATSTLTADNITVANPTANGANPGRFIRELISAPEWMTQTTWVMSSSGNDENTGLDAANALLTDEERRRRMGSNGQFLANTAYHLRYLTDGYLSRVEGFKGTNTVIYIHASMNDGEGDLFFSGTATTVTALNPATNTRLQVTSASVPVSWTASNLLLKRLRMTSGAAIGAHAWVIKDQGGAAPNATAALTEMLIPAASLNAAPFVLPAATVTNPGNGDTFVVEGLRSVPEISVELRNQPNASPIVTTVILDSLNGLVARSDNTKVYAYGCQVSSQGQIISATYRDCRIDALFDDGGLKSIQGGFANGGLTFVANGSLGQSIIDHFTFQGSQFLILAGTSGVNGELWRMGQIGIYDNSATISTIYAKGVVRLGATPATVLYGSGNAGAFFVFQPQGVILTAKNFLSTQTVTTTFASQFVEGDGGTLSVTALPAFDPATSLYTAPRTMTFANFDLSVAAGGFGYKINSPYSGHVVAS